MLFGANDACLESAAGSQHVPLDRFRKNLVSVITHPAILEHRARIVLLTPPPINEYGCEEVDMARGIGRRREASHTRLYAAEVRGVAQEYGLVLVDLYALFTEMAGYNQRDDDIPGSKKLPENAVLRRLLHDGLHMSYLAYTFLFETVMETIHKNWPDQLPEKLPFVLPAWNDEKAWAVRG